MQFDVKLFYSLFLVRVYVLTAHVMSKYLKKINLYIKRKK